MITAVGSTGITRAIELRSDSVGKTEPATKIDPTGSQASNSVTTLASELASQGAPVDSAKVASIREQIANGTYKIDPQAIAARMIETDLPSK